MANFQTGDLVWAKIKGYPQWPGMIIADDALPPQILDQKPKGSAFNVHFFGSRDFKADLKPYSEFFKEFATKNKSKLFQIAVEESKVEGSLDTPPQIDIAATTTTSKKKRISSTAGMLDDEDEDAPVPKKRKSGTGEKRKSRGEGASSADSKKSIAVVPEEITQEFFLSLPVEVAKEHVMKMRIKLQKFLQQKEERDEQSFEKANECLKQVEMLPLNPEFYEHLKVTKLGKVLKKIPQLEFVVDTYDIQNRITILLGKWKSEIGDHDGGEKDQAEGSQEELLSPRRSHSPMKIDENNDGEEDLHAKSPTKNTSKTMSHSLREKSKSPAKGKSPAKETVKVVSPVKEKSPAKETLKVVSPVKEKSPAKETVKVVSPVKAKSPAKETVKVVSPVKAKSPAKETVKVVSPVKAKSPAKETLKVVSPVVREKSKSPAKEVKKVHDSGRAKSPVKEKVVVKEKSPLKEAATENGGSV